MAIYMLRELSREKRSLARITNKFLKEKVHMQGPAVQVFTNVPTLQQSNRTALPQDFLPTDGTEERTQRPSQGHTVVSSMIKVGTIERTLGITGWSYRKQ